MLLKEPCELVDYKSGEANILLQEIVVNYKCTSDLRLQVKSWQVWYQSINPE